MGKQISVPREKPTGAPGPTQPVAEQPPLETEKPKGQSAEPAPQKQPVTQEPVKPPVQTQPKEFVIDDPEAVIVNSKGERFKMKDAEFYGFDRQRQLEEHNRLAGHRKEIETLVHGLNAELSDPVIRDYRSLRRSNPGWSPQEALDATLRAHNIPGAHGSTPPEQPKTEALEPPPAGAVPGDPAWDAWQERMIDKALEKRLNPLLQDAEQRRTTAERQAAAERIYNDNVDLIQRQTQMFTDVNLSELTEDERNTFYSKVGETLAEQGISFDNASLASAPIDRKLYALGVKAAWPAGTSPKKGEPTPAEIVTEHMNSGLGLVPGETKSPAPTPAATTLQQQTPAKPARRPGRVTNPMKAWMEEGRVRGRDY